MDVSAAVREFLGGDPIAGHRALQELAALGGEGEEALFSQKIATPTVQVRRRWLRYVASRPETTSTRLLERVRESKPFHDMYAAASFFAGLPNPAPVLKSLEEDIGAAFFKAGRLYFADNAAFWRVGATLDGWGAAGGEGRLPWTAASSDRYAWEKMRGRAFSAACSAAARTRGQHQHALAYFVSYEWSDYEGLRVVAAANIDKLRQPVEDADIAWECYNTFPLWRSGHMADVVLSDWCHYDHWRVGAFGAKILAAIGLRRAVGPVFDWLSQESQPEVRKSLICSLGSGDTAAGADALLGLHDAGLADFKLGDPDLRNAIAEVGWRATNKSLAVKVLQVIADGNDTAAAEALVSLARLRVRPAQLAQAIVSADSYRRTVGALAVGHLGDQRMVDQLLAMRAETSGLMEPVYVSAALALLGHPGSAEDLHDRLVEQASFDDDGRRGDVFKLKRPLKGAIVAALTTGGVATKEFANAWQLELEPLAPTAQPGALPHARAKMTATPLHGAGNAAPKDSATHDVFISHASEDKETIARPLHDALVEKGLRVWFDESALTMGDSLRRSIDDGLARCRFGVVILSPSFFEKEWPKRELDGLFARETASGRKALLPVWHEIEHEGVAAYSPMLADRTAARGDRGLGHVVEQILRALDRSPKT